MTRDELERVFRETVLTVTTGRVAPSKAVDMLLGAASAYTASQIEERCRTPRSQQGPGRRQQGESNSTRRRSA